ncbi:hypothetical protein GCM10011379_49750 [Filimonas zeae]|uniref:TIGR02117 family protein n=2 Tax=Filimonas zeae TaxID=1737353 RepID=A0A917J360_9BACT|nr:hypothetical protein GCM10011379_49750 [Filimonas zeae]
MTIVKKILRMIAYSALTLVALLLLYLLSAFTLSRISTAREKDTRPEMAIYILTNGVHTDLVVPVKSEYIDWSQYIPFSNTSSKDTTAQWLAFGWGDKGFYLETPTWADLKFGTAFKAAFRLSTSAVHATYYRMMSENKECRKIEISKAQYARLVAYIRNTLDTTAGGMPVYIPTTANYGKHDAFYEARGSYHLFHTCNTWANNGLKSCGQKACVWTIFDTGIFYQYK